MNQRFDRSIAAWLALWLFGIYLLTYSGQIYSGDGMSMFSVTESFVKRGELNTDQLWTLFKSRNEIAADGESYAKYGYGTSLFSVPLYALALILPGVGLVQTTLLASALAIAFAGALVYLATRRLLFSRGVSIMGTLLFGLATPAWVYARELWSEPFGLVTLFAAFYFLQCYRDESHRRDALSAGSMLALAVAVRVTNAALAPVFAWYGFDCIFRSSRARRDLVFFILPLALAGLSIAGYDWVRFGNPLTTGYRADETFDNPILLGVYGLLFSPGKGLFIYIPFLATLPWSAVMFYRRARRELFLVLFIFAFYLFTFSLWYYWWGGTSWSTRFLVPTWPFLVLAVAPAIELATRPQSTIPRKIFSVIFAGMCLLSFAIEILGISVPTLAYRVRMVRISANPEMDAVFLPQFSPLVGYFDLLKPSVLDFAWIRVIDGNVIADWTTIALALAFIVLCIVALRALCAKQSFDFAALRPGPLHAMTLCGLALSLVVLYRAADDPRFGGSDGYRALLQTVQRDAQLRDVLILNDDARVSFFLNENRAAIRWYGLSRDPKQFDDATRALCARLAQQSSHIWLAFDDANAQLPDPLKDWLDQSLRPISQSDFDDGVHLILYATDALK